MAENKTYFSNDSITSDFFENVVINDVSNGCGCNSGKESKTGAHCCHRTKSTEKDKSNSTEHKKSATDNEWTSNNTKYFPDERERQDGPGGN